MGTIKKINPKKVVEARKSLADKLTGDLEKQGVVFFTPTEHGGNLNIEAEFLSLPSDLTEIPSRDLGNYLNAFTQQKAYMRTVFSWQQALVQEKKREYYDKYVEVYSELTKENPKMSERAKELFCNNHKDVYNEFIEYKNCETKLSMVDMTIETLTEFIFLVSREISRRGADFNENERTYNAR